MLNKECNVIREEGLMEERIKLVEKEIQTLTSELQRVSDILGGIDDIRFELKGIKVFLGRKYPEFKTELPEIVRKLKDKTKVE